MASGVEKVVPASREREWERIDAFTREYLEHLLARHAGNMTRVAADAGIDRNQVYRLVKRYQLAVDRSGD